MDIRLLENLDPDKDLGVAWEKLVKGNAASGFMQSLHWAKFKRRQGLAVIHIGLFEGDDLIGGCLCYRAPASRGLGLLVAPEGPVLPWGDEEQSTCAMQILISWVEKNARDLEVMAMRIEPRLPLPVPRLLSEFGPAPIDLIPRETLYLDLRCGAENALAQMKPKGRYNIRLAEKRGVQVVHDDSPDAVRRFYPVLLEAAKRDHFTVEPLSFFAALSETLCPPGLVRFLFAQKDDETLGALLLMTYGQRSTYLYGGISNSRRNLMGGYALQWAAIEAGIATGAQTYDFYGYDAFQSPLRAYGRFSRFKSKFGGQVARFVGAHDYFMLDRLADVFVRVANEVGV